MKYEKRKLVEEEVDIDLKFPFYMARHRRYTYAKFELVYYDHDPNAMKCVLVTFAEKGFSMDTKIAKRTFGISRGILPSAFIDFYNEYEHTVAAEEYQQHFDEVLSDLK